MIKQVQTDRKTRVGQHTTIDKNTQYHNKYAEQSNTSNSNVNNKGNDIISVYKVNEYIYIPPKQSNQYYYEDCMEQMLCVDDYALNRNLYCGPCGEYHQKQWPLELCENCGFSGCPHCLRPDLELPACLLCITGDSHYRKIYGTDHPTRIGKIECVAEYPSPKCIFFKDPYGYYYKAKDYKQWTIDEKDAYYNKPSKDQYYTFKQTTMDLKYHLSNSQKREITTTYYRFPGNEVGVIQLKGFFNNTNIGVYQQFIKHQVNPRWNDFKLYQTQSQDLWRDYFNTVYCPLSTAISNKRIQIMGGRGWVVGPGKKKQTHKSSLSNEQLFTKQDSNYYGWNIHVNTTMDILHAAARLGIIGEREIDTFYGDNLCLLCNNSITYTGGACMHIHRDISVPHKNDGFDLRLIAIGTFDVQDTDTKKGNKLLSFSGTTKMMRHRMNVKQETGDLTLIFPPATTKWWHLVPCVQARRATTIQWRRWLGMI